jgi:hypothetical protein
VPAVTIAGGVLLFVGGYLGWRGRLARLLARPLIGERLASRWGGFIAVAYPVMGVFFIVVGIVIALGG